MSTPSSYRDLANSSLAYKSELRDHWLDHSGLWVDAWILNPGRVGVTNLAGDIEEDPEMYTYSLIPVQPKYDEYYALIDILDNPNEPTLPLEIIARIKDTVPEHSIMRIPLKDTNGLVVQKFWEVLSSEVKHLEQRYSKFIKVAPYRRRLPQALEIHYGE
jgi:hypothetical protein